MIIYLDRFEGDFGVCETEDGGIFNVPAALLKEFSEGDTIELSKKENTKRHENIKNLMDSLFTE